MLKQRALDLLAERFGASSQPTEAVFAQGAVNLLSDHTHYSDGFAILMPVKQGVAVAMRRARGSVSQVTFVGDEAARGLDPAAEAPAWVCVAERVVAQIAPSEDPVEMAVVSTLPSSCFDAYLATLAVATARAVLVHGRAPEKHEEGKDVVPYRSTLCRILATCADLPFSIAFPMVSCAGGNDPFTLVDTGTCEHLPIETTARSELGWMLIEPKAALRDGVFHRRCRQQAGEAIAWLQEHAFEGLTSFRDLEHRDLPRAARDLPSHLVPVVRHLVTENRRVQKLVAAVRRNDWQMVGALLLMAHASRRDEWGGTTPQADFLVAHIESMTLESIYGACMTGRGGYVIVVGQPHAMMLCLDRLTAAFDRRFGYLPDAMPL